MLPLRSYWLALLLLSQEVCCPHRLVDPTSLADWRCSCLCSKLIPSVTEKSVIFIKELSFPQTGPTNDAFFNRNWAGACGRCWAGPGLLAGCLQAPGSSGLKWDCCSAGLQALDMVLLCKSNKEGGRRGLRPWPLRCPCQFLYERKDRLLRGRMNYICLHKSLCTFHRWGGHVFIVDVQPVGP